MLYRVENCNTGAELMITAKSAKEAHEAATALWPLEPIEVCTVSEYTDRQTFIPGHNQIMDTLEGISPAIAAGDYAEVLRCLGIARAHVGYLEQYFRTRYYQDTGHRFPQDLEIIG